MQVIDKEKDDLRAKVELVRDHALAAHLVEPGATADDAVRAVVQLVRSRSADQADADVEVS